MDKKKRIIDTRAVAIKYNVDEIAPKVVGKGRGYVAEKLLEQAKYNKIPVYKDPSLVRDLMGVNLGDNIPPELYEVVASVLVFISDLDKMEEYRKSGGK